MKTPLLIFLSACFGAAVSYAIIQERANMLSGQDPSAPAQVAKTTTQPPSGIELGNTYYDGKQVTLYTNNTWHFSEDDAPSSAQVSSSTPSYTAPRASANNDADCKNSVRLPEVEYCLPKNIWRASQKPTSDYESAFVNNDATLYMGVITEGLAVSDALFKTGIMMLAKNAAGGDQSKVKTLMDRKISVNGQPWNYLEYSVDLEGTVFRYANYYRSVGKKGSIQILFYTLDDAFEDLRPVIGGVSQSLKVAE